MSFVEDVLGRDHIARRLGATAGGELDPEALARALWHQFIARALATSSELDEAPTLRLANGSNADRRDHLVHHQAAVAALGHWHDRSQATRRSLALELTHSTFVRLASEYGPQVISTLDRCWPRIGGRPSWRRTPWSEAMPAIGQPVFLWLSAAFEQVALRGSKGFLDEESWVPLLAQQLPNGELDEIRWLAKTDPCAGADAILRSALTCVIEDAKTNGELSVSFLALWARRPSRAKLFSQQARDELDRAAAVTRLSTLPVVVPQDALRSVTRAIEANGSNPLSKALETARAAVSEMLWPIVVDPDRARVNRDAVDLDRVADSELDGLVEMWRARHQKLDGLTRHLLTSFVGLEGRPQPPTEFVRSRALLLGTLAVASLSGEVVDRNVTATVPSAWVCLHDPTIISRTARDQRGALRKWLERRRPEADAWLSSLDQQHVQETVR